MIKDYCTNWFEGYWGICCKYHDKDYYKSGISREKADILLRDCVIKTLYNKYNFRYTYIISYPIGYIMYIGVRIFGKSHYTRKQRITIKKRKRQNNKSLIN